MLPNAGCLSEWHDAGREETVLQDVRAYQIFRSQLARSSCGTPYSAPARIYARTYGNQTHRSDDDAQQQVHDEVQERSQNYAFMLYNLMTMIQENLLLTDDDKQRGALNSSDLVGGTAQLNENNRICIWLEDLEDV